MDITGRVFDILHLNDKTVQVVLKKRVKNKTTLMAFECFGFWRDIVVNELKLKKNDKIYAKLTIRSRFYKTKYYTDVGLRNIEVLTEKQKAVNHNVQEIEFIQIKDENGNVLL